MKKRETTERARRELANLADSIARRTEAIVEAWREMTMNAPEVAIVNALTPVQFTDHIPDMLSTVTDRLRSWPREAHSAASEQVSEHTWEHGLQRWQQGYQLRELTRELGFLQICVMEELEQYALDHPDLDPQVMPQARRIVLWFFCDTITDSSVQYWRVHQAEAAGHVAALEKALATLSELDRARAEAWREAAHDLRGSLSVVRTASSMLDVGTDPLKGEFFEMLQTGVLSLQEMLTDLMSLARLEAGHERLVVAPFDAGELLADFCKSSRAMAEERGLYLEMEGPDSLEVEGDRIKIRRIAQNLLLNALKYTESGGITLGWGVAGSDPESWMFYVRDTGPGIGSGVEQQLAQQLYDATRTSKKFEEANVEGNLEERAGGDPVPPAGSEPLPAHPQPGEGVGLSIVKRLCELLDASLELESSENGSLFRVTIPRRYEPAQISNATGE